MVYNSLGNSLRALPFGGQVIPPFLKKKLSQYSPSAKEKYQTDLMSPYRFTPSLKKQCQLF